VIYAETDDEAEKQLDEKRPEGHPASLV